MKSKFHIASKFTKLGEIYLAIKHSRPIQADVQETCDDFTDSREKHNRNEKSMKFLHFTDSAPSGEKQLRKQSVKETDWKIDWFLDWAKTKLSYTVNTSRTSDPESHHLLDNQNWRSP